MAIDSTTFLKGNFDAANALGAKAISSDFAMEIEGMESSLSYLLCKQAPWAITTHAGEIEVAGPNGMAYWQRQQIKTNQQGAVSFYETQDGAVQQALARIAQAKTPFTVKVYDGTPQYYKQALIYRGCFFNIDPVDRDWENRGQVMMITGTLFYNFFNEVIAGNIDTDSEKYDTN